MQITRELCSLREGRRDRYITVMNLFIYQMRSLTLCLVLAGCVAAALAHSYHLGACPVVEPLAGFQMSRVIII